MNVSWPLFLLIIGGLLIAVVLPTSRLCLLPLFAFPAHNCARLC